MVSCFLSIFVSSEKLQYLTLYYAVPSMVKKDVRSQVLKGTVIKYLLYGGG